MMMVMIVITFVECLLYVSYYSNHFVHYSDTGRLRFDSKKLKEFLSNGFIIHATVRSEVMC